jgi:glycosyltransferase involved in cell wall biosynthesis
MHLQKISSENAYRFLSVDLEPTPYKTDLWNAFSDSKEIGLFVIYTERKNWSPDGGHNYLKWPAFRHKYTVLEGKGILGKLYSAWHVFKKICSAKTDLIYIAGYVDFVPLVAIISSILLRRNFVVHADEFNNNLPPGKFSRPKYLIRELLRSLIFKFSNAILVCGKRGIESGVIAGCKKAKLLDFPYVIDVKRIRIDAPEVIPTECLQDVTQGVPIIFFSGRMISRKGLPTLLTALTGQSFNKKWILWIEGDGPELSQYQTLAQKLGLQDRCRFLGFCQYDLHSWLIRSSDIVVVPSLIDNWGIVVDEGIQLGKPVISSDATGSGYDRIADGQNGFIFPAGDIAALDKHIVVLLEDPNLRARIGKIAISGNKNFSPTDNLETLLNLIRKR